MPKRATDTTAHTAPEQQALIDYYAGPDGRAPRLTETGYAVRNLSPAHRDWLAERLAETWFAPGHPHFAPEHDSVAESARAALLDERWELDQLPDEAPVPSWVNQTDGSYQKLLNELLPIHQEWAGIALRPAQYWGPRVYHRHAVLARHVDIPTTHVVSSSITIAAKLDEPWPIVLELDSGEPVEVDLQPGQVLLYEGSRLPHYRPNPLAGEHYINLYLHYFPAEASFDTDVMAWVIPRRGEGAT